MAKDLYHNLVKEALIVDGWTITHDPYHLDKVSKWQIDLGAEKIIGAEKGNQKIAVEVKTFLKSSFSNEFHTIVGQYINYLYGLEEIENDRVLYLAVPSDVYKSNFHKKVYARSIKRLKINIIVYNIQQEKIEQWIKYS